MVGGDFGARSPPPWLRDLQLGQWRQIRRHRIAKQHATLLDQRHDRDGGHRLSHRSDRGSRVSFQGLVACRVAIADRFEMGELARAHNANDGSR